MPVYEYECQACRHVFTVTLSVKQHDEKTAKCPQCGSANLQQLLSGISAKTSRKS